MLPPIDEQTGEQNRRPEHRDDGHGIALNGARTLNSLAAGYTREPRALTGSIVAPVGQGVGKITRHVAGIVRQGLADVPGLATQFADLGGKGVERILSTAAGREQIFKMHGILPGYGRNAIGRTQVPYTINDFDLAVTGRHLGSRMVST